MSTRVFVTGPLEIWVNSYIEESADPILRFLGWGERGASIHLTSKYKEVITDAGGDVPTDCVFAGEEAWISVVLTVWDYAVYENIAARVLTNQPENPGSGVTGKVGTFLGANSSQVQNNEVVPGTQSTRVGGATRLCCVASRQPVLQPPLNDAPAGWNFPFAWLDKSNDLDCGSRFQKISCIFRAIPLYNGYEYTLYDYDITGATTPD